MRRAVPLLLVLLLGLSACVEDAADRRAEFRSQADERAAALTDCRLVVVAWAAARDKRTRAEKDDVERRSDQKKPRTEALERAQAEVQALVARAQQLKCAGVQE